MAAGAVGTLKRIGRMGEDEILSQRLQTNRLSFYAIMTAFQA
jgi:hypothetical protein